MQYHITETGCWEFDGSKTAGGYGHIGINGKHIYTHRLAYQLFVGIPANKRKVWSKTVIDHMCENKACINPEHLQALWAEKAGPDKRTVSGQGEHVAVTNERRGFAGQGRTKLYCKYDHPKYGENLYISPAGQRCCKECRRDAVRKRRAKA